MIDSIIQRFLLLFCDPYLPNQTFLLFSITASARTWTTYKQYLYKRHDLFSPLSSTFSSEIYFKIFLDRQVFKSHCHNATRFCFSMCFTTRLPTFSYVLRLLCLLFFRLELVYISLFLLLWCCLTVYPKCTFVNIRDSNLIIFTRIEEDSYISSLFCHTSW